ncbi:putative leucine-rich repeat receptor-like serine/threonine-protein kinase At2g24130 [Cryptomeria japonica]|uniref:putative leucine-rich repeat receptor-like serine/threonine-protein kinase At2g24130 n=1 Tax=Cryptomeria japonica TaxID=3369 RepID=UPI0027DA6C41|nr:putative leucine-rich repeat receptor-like serine/threonine-protein kinase At2g24130 [Cryptomeria japonica]
MAAFVMHIEVLLLIILLCAAVIHSYSYSTSSNLTDQRALLSFKDSIVYDPYNSLHNWDPNYSLCNWTGIQCSLDSQRVVALNISGMDIQAPVSPLLANISFLEVLDISNNHFHGYIPPQLGSLIGLRKLVLHGNELEGPIPKFITGCFNLTVLSLSHNHLSGHIPAELGMLTKIEILDLGLNNFTGSIPLKLGNLPKLISLDLGENNLYGPIPASLSNCTFLKQLVLKENQLNGPLPSEFGAKLSNLQELHLWGNSLVGDIPVSLTNCSQLRLLFLNENKLSGTVPIDLGKLSLLESLYLHENQLFSTPTLPFLSALTNCTHLQKIDVSNNPLGGVLPISIARLSKKLTLLDLSNISLGGSIPSQIGNLTSLTYLALADNLLTGSIPSEIKMLHRLERLRLRNNKLQGPIPSEISQLRNLGSLSLRQNMLSGTIPHSLGDLVYMRRLLLSENQLSGNIPFTLGKCWRMELLDLSWNRLSGSIPRELGGLSNLQFYFNLSHNSLEGSLPPELGKMGMVQTMDISFNQLTGHIPEALGSCTGLSRLDLCHNSLQGPIPESLSKMKNLEKLDFSSNNLSGAIPKSLGKLPMLHTVNFSFNNLRGEVPIDWGSSNLTFKSLMGNPGLCGVQSYLHPCSTSSSQKQQIHLLLVVMIVFITAIASFVLCCLFMEFSRSNYLYSRISSIQRAFSFQKGQQMIPYEALVKATDGFSDRNKIGAGRFGSVYRGILDDGTTVAVKVLNLLNKEASKDFITECRVFGSVRHRNLVRIINYCSMLHFKALVLQLIHNGSLENHLYPNGDKAQMCRLRFSQILNISIDIAQGMAYLHHHCFVQVVHCDLKPSNVLLDGDMTAHICDVGIARLINADSTDSLTSISTLRGSIGYIAPEYGYGSRASTKGDVYSFGIILLEMMTRKKPTSSIFVGGLNLHKWVSMACPHRMMEVVDFSLMEDTISDEKTDSISQVLLLGLECTRESPEQRPTMTEVVGVLEGIRNKFVKRAGASELSSNSLSSLDSLSILRTDAEAFEIESSATI